MTYDKETPPKHFNGKYIQFGKPMTTVKTTPIGPSRSPASGFGNSENSPIRIGAPGIRMTPRLVLTEPDAHPMTRPQILGHHPVNTVWGGRRWPMAARGPLERLAAARLRRPELWTANSRAASSRPSSLYIQPRPRHLFLHLSYFLLILSLFLVFSLLPSLFDKYTNKLLLKSTRIKQLP